MSVWGARWYSILLYIFRWVVRQTRAAKTFSVFVLFLLIRCRPPSSSSSSFRSKRFQLRHLFYFKLFLLHSRRSVSTMLQVLLVAVRPSFISTEQRQTLNSFFHTIFPFTQKTTEERENWKISSICHEEHQAKSLHKLSVAVKRC